MCVLLFVMPRLPIRFHLWMLVWALGALAWLNLFLCLAPSTVTVIGPDPHALAVFQIVDALSLLGSTLLLILAHRCATDATNARAERAALAYPLARWMAALSIVEPAWSARYVLRGDIGWIEGLIGHSSLGLIGVLLYAACAAVMRSAAREVERDGVITASSRSGCPLRK